MKTEFGRRVFSLVEAAVHRQISPFEFEMAYQARVAIDRIRFAIKVTEHSLNQPEQLQEACFQLLDALNRLEGAEQHFQRRFRSRFFPNGTSEQNMNGFCTASERDSATGEPTL